MTKSPPPGIIDSVMRLHQLKVEFDAEQDRLLMRVSTASSEEAMLWLTRRCVIRLWELLIGFVQSKPDIVARAADPATQRTLMEFEHEKAISQATFSKPYEDSERVQRAMRRLIPRHEPVAFVVAHLAKPDERAHAVDILLHCALHRDQRVAGGRSWCFTGVEFRPGR